MSGIIRMAGFSFFLFFTCYTSAGHLVSVMMLRCGYVIYWSMLNTPRQIIYIMHHFEEKINQMSGGLYTCKNHHCANKLTTWKTAFSHPMDSIPLNSSLCLPRYNENYHIKKLVMNRIYSKWNYSKCELEKIAQLHACMKCTRTVS